MTDTTTDHRDPDPFDPGEASDADLDARFAAFMSAGETQPELFDQDALPEIDEPTGDALDAIGWDRIDGLGDVVADPVPLVPPPIEWPEQSDPPPAVEPTEPIVRVPLPEGGDGSRASLRADQRKDARRRVGMQLAGALAVLAVVTAGSLAIERLSGDGSSPEATAAPPVAPAAEVAEAAPTLVVLNGESGVIGLTAFAHDPSGDGGAMILIPTGAMVEVPSFGLEPVGRAAELGGLPLVESTVENVLGTEIGSVVTVDSSLLSVLFSGTGIDVDVPEPVERVDDSGRVETLWSAGPATLVGSDVAEFVMGTGDGDELALLARHRALWSAWLAAISSGDWVPPDGLIDTSGLTDIAHQMAAGDTTFHLLPVERLSTAGDEASGDLYRVDKAALADLMNRLDGAPPAEGDAVAARTRVQVLNGAGVPGLAQKVTDGLAPGGVEVLIVENADRFDYATTQVVYYDRDEIDRARQVKDLLGVGELVFSRRPLDVVDVTVVVGLDYVS